MNQDKVKDILLQIEDSGLDFSVTFTGKASKKVNGLYKSDTHEILLHNKNFSVDNELLYTAIHEYTHHRLYELDGTRKGRVHTQRFWSYFHHLLQKAEEKGLYHITLDQSPELLELTDRIRTAIIAEDGKLIKEFGMLLGKARTLCKQAGVRYEDYIDRVLCLPRTCAATIEKIHAYDIKPELGYEAMKVVANIANPAKRAAAEELFLHKNSPAAVRAHIKDTPAEQDPRCKLENEKKRIERTITHLQERLDELEKMLASLPVTPLILCFLLLLHPVFFRAVPLAAEHGHVGSGLIDVPAVPDVPEVSIEGGMLRPAPVRVAPPRFLPHHSVGIPNGGAHEAQKKNAPAAVGKGARDAAGKKMPRTLTAHMLSALTEKSGNVAALNALLGNNSVTGGSFADLQGTVSSTLLAHILTEMEKLQEKASLSGEGKVNKPAEKTITPAYYDQNRRSRARPDAANRERHEQKDAVRAEPSDAKEASESPVTATSISLAAKAPSGPFTVQKAASSAVLPPAAADLVRLRINGRDIKNDLVYTFCSSPSKTGSFLYGADRMFTVNKTELNETIYFLCRKTEAHQYEIAMDVRQEPLNTNSFLYKLSLLSPLSIEPTSDILFLHYKDKEFEVELIFRLAGTALSS